ncbi:MAG: hypothetical protein MN733_23765 [Nitrososphaera sp.]|nr:hypothetical protein [Nitrososphaera sp.]
MERGLIVTLTLGVSEAAAESDLLNLPEVIQELERTNFRIDPTVVREVLNRDAERIDAKRVREKPRSRSRSWNGAIGRGALEKGT